jgi:predicted nuclease of predicted toxin-antitoxin system
MLGILKPKKTVRCKVKQTPKSASYDRIDLTALERNDMGEFIADARNEFVDHSKLENLSVIKLDEHLTASSFPLTSEAELYLLSLNPLEPGKLVSILQKSLVKSVEKRNEYFISKSDIEDTIKENFSTILFRCIHCGSRLSMLIVETTSPAGNRPPKIKAVKCPHCNLTTDNLVDYLPNILKTIALDTSSLVSLDFSALNNWLGELKKQRVKVIISKAVLSEMSSWDKKPDKYIISRLARQEYQMLVSLDSTGKILLINDAGRNPTFAEIREATSFNSIDRLIIDIAEIEGATLFTHDQDMASYSCGRAGFTFLFKSE